MWMLHICETINVLESLYILICIISKHPGIHFCYANIHKFRVKTKVFIEMSKNNLQPVRVKRKNTLCNFLRCDFLTGLHFLRLGNVA